MSTRGGDGAAVTPIATRSQVPPLGEHIVYMEELIAHVTSQHACQHADQYMQRVIAEEVERRARRTPLGADGQAAITIDGAALLGADQHRHALESFHRSHSHDWSGADVPASLHPWMKGGHHDDEG